MHNARPDPLHVEQLADDVDRFWSSDLERHFADEERLLLPLMKWSALQRFGDRMLDEHRVIRELVQKARRSPDDLARFADMLRRHIRFEERELFPAIEAELRE